jgi:hypothetical protein
MKLTAHVSPAWALAACVVLSSCGSLREAGSHSVAMVRNSTAAAATKLANISKVPGDALADLLPGPRVDVVKVREKDLKPLPTGHERAIAFESQHKRGFWFFGGPVDFKEPTLPEPGSEMDGSLLPPRIP